MAPSTWRQCSDADAPAVAANAFAARVVHSGSDRQLSSITAAAAWRATYTSARRCFTAWNAPMGWPNCSRTFA